ncbi:MAG: MAPEG family protein [Arenimonas sp.]
MHKNMIFLPALVQILLTIVIFIWLGIAKSKAAKLGLVDQEKRALHPEAWPDFVLKISNNINNQFETPVLFYALVLMLWAMDSVGIYALVFAWGFVITRIIHAYIHTGSNIVPARRRVFTIGCVFLFLLTLLGLKQAIAAWLLV